MSIIFRKGKLVTLRPIMVSNVDDLLRIMNDQNTVRFLATAWPTMRSSEEDWVKKLADDKHNIVLGIYVGDKFIGVTGLHEIDYINRVGITGTVIGEEEFRGRGYGTDAKMLLLQYAFAELDLFKVNSRVYSFNERSRRALIKQGYVEEGIMRSQIYREGTRHDVILLAVFRDAFMKKWEEYQVANTEGVATPATNEFGTESNSSPNEFYGGGGI